MEDNVKKIVKELMSVAFLAVDTSDDLETQRNRIDRLTRKEMLSFILYLSASDGFIEISESRFIKDYLGEQLSPEEMRRKIEEENIYSMTFEQRAPLILKKLVKLDNLCFEKSGKLDYSQAERYICLYEAFGKEFIASDCDVTQNEMDDLNTYITNMRSYYRANYRGPDEATKAAHTEYSVRISKVEHQQYKNRTQSEDNVETLDVLLGQLDGLVGLNTVKATVRQLIHFNKIRQVRDDRGMAQLPVTQHMVFYGNPGTGKTTVARLIAKIYHHLGLLSKGHLVEVDRSGLVAGYVGHTALKVKKVIKESKGGVLFIDEAYALTYKRSENDFGWEAVDTLIKAMEDERDDLIVIVAGYPEPMNHFINSNPGLKSRFNRYINFEDYNANQLLEIYHKMMYEADYESTEEALKVAECYFADKVLEKDKSEIALGFNARLTKKKQSFEGKDTFSNARLVRNFLESAMMNQADRLYGMNLPSDSMLRKLEYEDVIGLV